VVEAAGDLGTYTRYDLRRCGAAPVVGAHGECPWSFVGGTSGPTVLTGSSERALSQGCKLRFRPGLGDARAVDTPHRVHFGRVAHRPFAPTRTREVRMS